MRVAYKYKLEKKQTTNFTSSFLHIKVMNVTSEADDTTNKSPLTIWKDGKNLRSSYAVMKMNVLFLMERLCWRTLRNGNRKETSTGR